MLPLSSSRGYIILERGCEAEFNLHENLYAIDLCERKMET